MGKIGVSIVKPYESKFQFHRNYLTKIGNNAHIKHGAIEVMLPSCFLSRLRFISFIVKKGSGQGWLPVTCGD